MQVQGGGGGLIVAKKDENSAQNVRFNKNKNRLCSMTCGIDNVYKIDRLDTKRFFLKGIKYNLNEEKRSHPEEKSG